MKGDHNYENKKSISFIIWCYFTNCLSTFD
jgi:hypothetical protein